MDAIGSRRSWIWSGWRIYQPAAVEVIGKLTPVVRENPGDLHSVLALGRALVREGGPRRD